MSSRRLHQATISFSRSKQKGSQKESAPSSSEELRLQCPICLENVPAVFFNHVQIPKSIIEEHVEQCLELNKKSVNASPIKKIPESIVSQSPVKISLTQIESQTEQSPSVQQSPKVSRKIHNERQPLAERVRPTEFKDIFVFLIGIFFILREILTCLVQMLSFALS